MATLTSNGVRIYYETSGAGAPLLLIAGLASDSQSWLPVTAELGAHCRLIMPDNRGAGRSAQEGIDISVGKMADDCAALVRHLGLPSVNLLGHSMGGLVALDCAMRYPGLVDRLVLAGISAPISARNNALLSDWALWRESGMDLRLWFRSIFYWLFTRRFFENEAAVQEAIRSAVDYPYPQSEDAFAKQVEAIADFNCTEDLPSITSKTMVIAGKEDILMPPEMCAETAKAIPNAGFALIEDAAHSIHMEQPRAFAECVLKFISVP